MYLAATLNIRVEREIDVRLRALRERLIALTARERALAYKIMEAIE